jgi:hypothetical protein
MRNLAVGLCVVLAAALVGPVFGQEVSPARQQAVSTQFKPSQSDAQTVHQKTDSSVPSTQNSRAPITTKNDSDHKIRFRWGGVTVGAGYSYFSAPYFPYYPFYGFGLYRTWSISPLFWGPCCSPLVYGAYPPPAFTYDAGKGELRLSSDVKDAAVYIDGAFAGTADRRKSMWLDAGVYDLSVSAKGRTTFQQRIYVLSGKSLKISAKLPPETVPEKIEAKPEALP